MKILFIVMQYPIKTNEYELKNCLKGTHVLCFKITLVFRLYFKVVYPFLKRDLNYLTNLDNFVKTDNNLYVLLPCYFLCYLEIIFVRGYYLETDLKLWYFSYFGRFRRIVLFFSQVLYFFTGCSLDKILQYLKLLICFM